MSRAGFIFVSLVCIVNAAQSEQPSEPLGILVDSTKVESESVTRAFFVLDLLRAQTLQQLVVYAPTGTSIWIDDKGTCDAIATSNQILTVPAEKAASMLCWRGDKEQTSRLIARMDLTDGAQRWISSDEVQFTSRGTFDDSFWAAVLPIVLGAGLTMLGAWIQLWYQDKKERDRAKREQDATELAERRELQLTVQKYLATELLPSITGWRAQLKAWEPASTVGPHKLNLQGTYSAQEPQRAKGLAKYFADAGQLEVTSSIKQLHNLASNYNDLTDAINALRQSDSQERVERQEKIDAAKDIRTRLLYELDAMHY